MICGAGVLSREGDESIVERRKTGAADEVWRTPVSESISGG